jgi:uracil-DNA glycosylase
VPARGATVNSVQQLQLLTGNSAVTLAPMSSAYHELLSATVQHLEQMKSRGTRFVEVSPESLRALSGPAPRQPTRPVAAAPIIPVARPATAALPSTLNSQPSTSPKAAALAEIRERALQCVKCAKLASTRTNVVFGVGNPDAELMFVGEAPGADEDLQGEPFVGAAGQTLTKMIGAMGLSRDQVYIANILKCRPDMPAGSSGNRKPTPEEMQTCIPYLHAQIDLIQPKVLVALGGTAVEGLLNQTGITKLRGRWQTYRNIPLMPTYHPAYLLRNQAMSEKRKVWEDLLAVMEKLNLPISEKQRGYFLRA